MATKKSTIKKTQIVSPGLVDGVVYHFLPSTGDTYFVKKDGDDEYQKADGKFVKKTFDECLNAREAYLVQYGEQEKEQKILAQMEVIKADTLQKAKEIVAGITRMECFRDGKWAGGDTVLGNMLESLREIEHTPAGLKERNRQQGEFFFKQNPSAPKVKEALVKMIEALDYEGIYNFLNFGKPIATFKYDDELSMNALLSLLHRDKIEQTVEELKGPDGAIRIAARAIVEKEY